LAYRSQTHWIRRRRFHSHRCRWARSSSETGIRETHQNREPLMRLLSLCKSKIHRATVTHTDVDYIGSIAVDADLLDRAGLLPGEKVAVWNVTNGERFETYALPA